MQMRAATSPGSMVEPTGLRAKIDSITSRLAHVPPSLHALFAAEYKLPGVPPEIAAVMATGFEIGCSTLLVLGLASRLATLPRLGMILTIQLFVYPQAWPEHLAWGSILLFLLTRGPGALSLDRLFGIESQTRPS